MDKVSYALGLGIGQQLKDMGAESLNIDDFAQAIKDVIAGTRGMDPDEAQALVQTFFAEQEKIQREKAAERWKENKARGEEFLSENKTKDGIEATASGLQYTVLRGGTGRKPKATDTVICHYEGSLIDGKVFDSSYRCGEPAKFGLNQVIAGWTEGLQLMEEGAKYRFFIPHHLGYGERGAGASIPPYSTLIFDVELLEVK